MKIIRTITHDMPIWMLAKSIKGLLTAVDALSDATDVYINRYKEDQPLLEYKEEDERH